MDYQRQFLQIALQQWKPRLGISETVIVFTNPDEWLEIFPQDRNRINKLGLSSREFPCIYINLTGTDHKLLSELEDTIVHELLHLKYPDKSEKEIETLTTKTLERYR